MDCAALSDEELTARLKQLVIDEKRSLRGLLVHLAEFDRRRLAVGAGMPSTFSYCVKFLGYSEGEAYRRIYSARAAVRWPLILDLLEKGAIHMTAVTLLASQMTDENHKELLEKACGKSKLELQRMIAELDPKPDSPDMMRRIPMVTEMVSSDLDLLSLNGDQSAIPTAPPLQPIPSRGIIEPTAPQRVRFAFTGSEELLNLLRRAQEVLKHKYPAGELERVFHEALEALLDKKDPDRKLRAKEERGKVPSVDFPPQNGWGGADSRRIPQAVKDAVWRRDGGQCVFTDAKGIRCLERGGLEFDHVVPFALGGASNNPKNIRLLCKAHNLMCARKVFGDEKIRERILRRSCGA